MECPTMNTPWRIMMTAAAATLLIGAVSLLPAPDARSQPASETRPDKPIDAAMRTQVIDTVLKLLDDSYVFPEKAREMNADIRTRVQKKEYDTIGSGAAFAEKLTADLQAVSKDKHLRVFFRATPRPMPKEG